MREWSALHLSNNVNAFQSCPNCPRRQDRYWRLYWLKSCLVVPEMSNTDSFFFLITANHQSYCSLIPCQFNIMHKAVCINPHKSVRALFLLSALIVLLFCCLSRWRFHFGNSGTPIFSSIIQPFPIKITLSLVFIRATFAVCIGGQ